MVCWPYMCWICIWWNILECIPVIAAFKNIPTAAFFYLTCAHVARACVCVCVCPSETKEQARVLMNVFTLCDRLVLSFLL